MYCYIFRYIDIYGCWYVFLFICLYSHMYVMEYRNISISVELSEKLRKLKVHPRQSYGEVIEGLLPVAKDKKGRE
jgi:hypothetical protein